MNATTIKLDGPILKELKEIQRSDQSLSALIRELLQSELRRRKMARAAQEYMSFLKDNPAEFADLEAWSSTALENDTPSKKRQK